MQHHSGDREDMSVGPTRWHYLINQTWNIMFDAIGQEETTRDREPLSYCNWHLELYPKIEG